LDKGGYIFSGILFSDILIGRIGEKPVDIAELEELELSDDLLDLLDIMRAEEPESRMDIQIIKDTLEDEWR